MAIIITKINESTYSYQEDGNPIITLDEKSIVLEKKTGIYWLKLPENSLNRKLVSTKKFDTTDEIVLDKIKAPVTHSGGSPRKSLEDYMTDEEKKIIEDIMNKARERKEADKKKPLTEREKLLEKIRKLQAKVDELSTEDED